jgi:hypothetical protein
VHLQSRKQLVLKHTYQMQPPIASLCGAAVALVVSLQMIKIVACINTES